MKRNVLHPDGQLFEQRRYSDRRSRHFKSLLYSLYAGNRINPRRRQEFSRGYYTDKYEKWVGLNVILITLLSATDAFLTLNILARGGIEVNPFMLALLDINPKVFLIVKLSVTVVCLIFGLIHINFQVLRVVPMKHILTGISVLYTVLIGYEMFLLAIM